MRLHRLQLQAFQAFAGREDVDFDRLTDSGLFLLHGDTGAGKTTLLDAICFAIYGKLPGARGADARIRSDHADPGTPTEVALELTVRGERLRIVRTPDQERPKARGEGMTRARETVQVSRIEANGSETVLAARPDEAGLELVERMGMNRAQFCQVVLLPQGEFATFLRAQSKDRLALLKPIFGAERFEHAETWLAEQARDAADALDRAVGAVRGTLAQIEQVSGSAPPDDWEDQPAVLPRWAGEQEDAARARAASAAEIEAAAGAARTAAQDAALDANVLAQRQARAAQARAALDEHRARASDRDDWVDELRRARAVRGVLPLIEGAARAAAARQEAERAALAGLAALEEEWRSVGAAALRDGASALDEQAGEAGALVPVEQEVQARRAAIDVQQEEQHTVEGDRRRAIGWLLGARERAAGALERLRAAQPDAQRAELAAHEAWLALRERRLDGMAAELAGGLADGAPCAVCGSLDHPSPAAAEDGVLVTQAQEQEAQAAYDRARAAREELDGRVDGAASLAHAAEAATADLPGDGDGGAAGRPPDGVTIAAVEARRTEVAGQTARLAALAAAIASAERALTEDEARLERARAGAATVADRVRALQEQARRMRETAAAVEALAHADGTAAEAAEQADRAAREAGFDDLDGARAAARSPEQEGALEQAVTGYASELAARTQRAEDPELMQAAERPAPDVASLDEAARAAVAAAEEASRVVGAAGTSVAQLERLRATVAAQVQELVPVAERAATTRVIAALAAGSRGSQNTKNMSLTTYVLAAWLEQIAAAASVRLGAMTEGRYRLAHTDEGTDGRRGAGLGLVVIDGWTGHERHPSTLSGGETFMASLALALGLADIVTAEAGGNRLETLFVDEGFGTLDEGTLEEVLDVLDRLREGGRVVGIVSHVPELRQRIPAQLHVAKGRTGSHVHEVTRGG